MARQASADRAWQAVARFDKNCREKKPGKKGYPRFQQDNRSAAYRTSGWCLEPDGKHITFTDGMGIGRLKLIGKKGCIETFPLQQIKRVRLLKRAGGYYCQFAVQAERRMAHEPTGKQVGIDVGLKAFSPESDGATGANPRYLRRAEKRLKRLHRRVSRKVKRSKNRKRAIRHLAKGYLKVQRQRKDFAVKAARTLVQSHDLVAFEDLKIAHLVKNHHLAREYQRCQLGAVPRLGALLWTGVYSIPIIAVPARFTTQDCVSVWVSCPEDAFDANA